MLFRSQTITSRNAILDGEGVAVGLLDIENTSVGTITKGSFINLMFFVQYVKKGLHVTASVVPRSWESAFDWAYV